MSKPRLLVALLAVAIAAVAIFVGTARESSTATPAGRAAERTRTTTPEPVLPGQPAAAVAPAVATEFLAVRNHAMGQFRSQLMHHVHQCAGGSAQSREVQFVFEHDAARSNADMQTIVVRRVQILDVAGIAAKSRDCVQQAVGMPMVIAASLDKLPADARAFAEIIRVPLS